MGIKERILEYCKAQSINKSEFERKAGLSNGYINSIRQGIGYNKLEQILKAFPSLNKEWLLNGDGTMLNEIASDSPQTEYKSNPQQKHNLLPLYDTASIGGMTKLSADMNGVVAPSSYVDTGSWFHSATAAIKHYGDSMVEYPSGCILAVKEVKDFELIIPGMDYVVETAEYRVTKKLQLGNREGYIMAYSTSTEKYPDGRLINEPFPIPLKAITRIFSVLGYIVQQNGEVIING